MQFGALARGSMHQNTTVFCAGSEPGSGKSPSYLSKYLPQGDGPFMWTILILFLLWILSVQFYLPLAVTLALFSVLVAVATITISFAWAQRRAAAVAKRDASPDFLKKAA